MPSQPQETRPPAGSRIAQRLAGAHFQDAWCIHTAQTGAPALAYFLAAVARTPRWIEWCMQARNRVGHIVGLKDLGTLSQIDPQRPASAYQPGERVGVFTVLENRADEALIGDSDKHLNVVLSIHRAPVAGREDQVAITITTVVHVHNLLGHLYMLPVAPMHRRIAPAVLAALGRVQPAAA
ncbi:DUF2867 domain-containing protein [Comamonas sp.]|uniref:DUF2867 domain-containing protein n=1 Tax=Comamonas sp. TaxID=34028 RepID=UPI00289E0415|nr:DUF2867 domain-containing protein [Comamonas sp.]